MTARAQPVDLTTLGDSAQLSARTQMRAELERLPPFSAEHAMLFALYDATFDELVERARPGWIQPRWEHRWTTPREPGC
jgi:hypothetical protein